MNYTDAWTSEQAPDGSENVRSGVWAAKEVQLKKTAANSADPVPSPSPSGRPSTKLSGHERGFSKVPNSLLRHTQIWRAKGWNQRGSNFDALLAFRYRNALSGPRLMRWFEEQQRELPENAKMRSWLPDELRGLGSKRRVQIAIAQFESAGFIRRIWLGRAFASCWRVEIAGIDFPWDEKLDSYEYLEAWSQEALKRREAREQIEAEGREPTPEEAEVQEEDTFNDDAGVSEEFQNNGQRWEPETIIGLTSLWNLEQRRAHKREISESEVIGALDFIAAWAKPQFQASPSECLEFLEAAAKMDDLWKGANWPLGVAMSETAGAKYFSRWQIGRKARMKVHRLRPKPPDKPIGSRVSQAAIAASLANLQTQWSR